MAVHVKLPFELLLEKECCNSSSITREQMPLAGVQWLFGLGREGLNSLGTTLWVFFNAECKFWETNTQKFAPIMLKILIRL